MIFLNSAYFFLKYPNIYKYIYTIYKHYFKQKYLLSALVILKLYNIVYDIQKIFI